MHWVQRLAGETIAIGANFSTVARYSTTGEFVGLTAMSGSEPGTRNRFLIAAVSGNGFGLGAPLENPNPRVAGTRWTDSLELQIVNDSGRVVSGLGPFPYIVVEQTGAQPHPVWLTAGGVFAGGDDHFFAGFGDRYEIRVYSTDGKLQSLIRRSWKPAPISPDDWEQWVVEWSKIWVKSTGPERERELQKMREEPYAFEEPAFSQFIVDQAGRLWVRSAHWQDAIRAGSLNDIPLVPSTWSVFDVGGRWLGDVTMPVNFQPFEIGADYVAGITRADGVTRVTLYDLRMRRR
jgi:hypothetical protein